MRFRVDEISSVIGEEIQQYRQHVDLTETGKVLEVGDGIAQVYGLSNAMAGELIAFSNGSMGQVFNLEESSVGVVILGDFLGIKEGDEVRRTGELVSIPCVSTSPRSAPSKRSRNSAPTSMPRRRSSSTAASAWSSS